MVASNTWSAKLKIFIDAFIAVLNPEEPKRMVWDVISMVFIFIQMITIPVILAFSIDTSGGYYVFDNLMNYFFIVDIFMSFNTGYYDRYLHNIIG